MSLNDIFEVTVGREKFRINAIQQDQLQQAIARNAEWFKFGQNTIKVANIQTISKIGETAPSVGLFVQLENNPNQPSGDIFNYPKSVRTPRLQEFYEEIRRLAKEVPTLAKELFDSEYKTMRNVAGEAGELSFIRFTHNFNKWYEGKS